MSDVNAKAAVPQRIVSLLPSATEIVCALGAGDRLVGISHECDFPPDVAGVLVLTAPRIDPARPSAAIDRDIAEVLKQALSVFALDRDALAAVRPDLVLTQTLCEACAVSLDQVHDALGQAVDGEVALVSLEPATLDDILSDVLAVGRALGLAEPAESLVAGLRDRVAAVSRTVEGLPRPRVACIEWLDPPMIAGNWVPELVAVAGGVPLLAEAGAHSDWLAWDDLLAADPDVIVLMPCGFDIDRCRAELPALVGRPGWAGLAAVRAGRVYLTDGNACFNRPGPRLADSAEVLAEILHPDAVPARHADRYWQQA